MIRCKDSERDSGLSAGAFELADPFLKFVHFSRDRGESFRERIVDLLGIGDDHALAFAKMMCPGTPTTVESSGTFRSTTEPAPMRQFFPMVMLPRIFAPPPITTPSSIVGCRLPCSLPVPPSVTP